ncbi:hypothetical protein E8E15_009107 [Penicillium rubens]|uniref:Uncharacterized protein n=1 Tax=Penicillium chrysogenum TaxID=5076 RepID=A0A167TK44_PENCH|nr:uncharacterized protein N7489_000863 [Penicillium chrysogenum]XP_061068338.1 uncharacterized protein N7525_007077 [Penicillium rubens]KAF3028152.1 hypothetical protein E8E15_009107 [Penicillium rubens]KAJ5250453.1 hypothetical protein N7489_000863 [Penicillium chrysogenum]KAJ5266063.1 hypothetical protein N7524_007081 [Penicillium chrysogenum]KAJ5269353.1 hypothetical protein N7505_005111 [Penicillium chrysogenum]KAJ5828824.1 hypothetical protein N7525_007077 [Penicillium rubens]
MGFLLLLFLVFFAPLLLFVAWLAASSCLGGRLRAVRPGLDGYGASYLRTMANSGPAMSEQIEMEDMLSEPGTQRHFEEDD